MEFTASLANRAIGVIRRGQARARDVRQQTPLTPQDGAPLLIMGSGVISRDNEERRESGAVTVAGQDTTRLRSRERAATRERVRQTPVRSCCGPDVPISTTVTFAATSRCAAVEPSSGLRAG